MNTYKLLGKFRDEFDLVEYCKGRFKYVRSGSNILVCCPYHEDHHPSCLVDTERAYCFSCGASVEAVDFVGQVEGRSREEILGESESGAAQGSTVREAQPKKRRVYLKPHPGYVEAGRKRLWREPDALAYLQDRGISLKSIGEYNLGYYRPPTQAVKHPRFSFPCYDETGELVSIIYRADPYYEPDSKKKYIIHPDTPASLFGLEKYPSCRAFLYTGGQIDAILLGQCGYPALGPTGEGTFKLQWGELLRQRKIYLLMDNDEAGREATQKLVDLMPHATLLFWPTGTWGYDAADLINDPVYGEGALDWMIRHVGGDKEEFGEFGDT